MEKRIYKYPLEITDKQSVEMPISAEILTVQIQKEKPFLWALEVFSLAGSLNSFYYS